MGRFNHCCTRTLSAETSCLNKTKELQRAPFEDCNCVVVVMVRYELILLLVLLYLFIISSIGWQVTLRPPEGNPC